MSNDLSCDNSWDSVVRGAQPGEHIAQMYDAPSFLHESVSLYAATALEAGEACIVVATPRNREATWARLEARGFDVAAAIDRGQVLALDADELLSGFMRGGDPDPARFHDLVGGAVNRTLEQWPGLRAFGEMVNILVESGNPDAAVALEELWNDLLADRRFSLLCAYRMDHFGSQAHDGPLQGICKTHTHLIPVDDYSRLEEAVSLALAEVIGHDETDDLKATLAAQARKHGFPRMPTAEAVLLGLRELAPHSADAVLVRASAHYSKSGCAGTNA